MIKKKIMANLESFRIVFTMLMVITSVKDNEVVLGVALLALMIVVTAVNLSVLGNYKINMDLLKLFKIGLFKAFDYISLLVLVIGLINIMLDTTNTSQRVLIILTSIISFILAYYYVLFDTFFEISKYVESTLDDSERARLGGMSKQFLDSRRTVTSALLGITGLVLIVLY